MLISIIILLALVSLKFNVITKIKNYIYPSKHIIKKIEIRDGGFVKADTYIKPQEYKELFKSNVPKWVNIKKKSWLFYELIPRKYKWNMDTMLLNGHYKKYKIIAINQNGHILLRVYAKQKYK